VRKWWLAACFAIGASTDVHAAHAAPPAKPPTDKTTDSDLERARQLFEEGIGWVKQHEWGRALEAFEKSEKLKPHAVTSYNIGACYRAIGRYTRARSHFSRALAWHESGKSQLTEILVSDSRRYLTEIDQLLVRVRVTVKPADARIAVDGAPLAREGSVDGLPQMVAGMRPAGTGKRLPARSVVMLVDPGAHVLVLSRKGFADVALNRTFTRQKNAPLDLALDRLPGRLRITANHAQARVELDGQFVGLAPLDIERPAGRYELTVSADDHESYKAQVDLDPGEDLTLKAKLVEETPSIVERWWFWTLAGVVVTGAVIGTYFAVRPEPERPPLNGGGLGWTVPLH
jgi:hypothetical protein